VGGELVRQRAQGETHRIKAGLCYRPGGLSTAKEVRHQGSKMLRDQERDDARAPAGP